jgi:tRNA G46 methylase TrmB
MFWMICMFSAYIMLKDSTSLTLTKNSSFLSGNDMGDNSNRLFDEDSIASPAFWEGYMKGRPRVPSSLFTRIYNYHKAHGGKFDVVNDIGAGIGNFPSEMAKQFIEVIAIEPNTKSLDLARKHLIPGGMH